MMAPVAGFSAAGAARARVAKRVVRRVVGFILKVGGVGGWLVLVLVLVLVLGWLSG